MLAGFGETVQVWRATPADRFGDRTWSLHHEVLDVLVDWSKSSMDRELRVQSTTDAVLIFQSDPDVEADDRIVVRGEKFAPDGTVEVWRMGSWEPGATLPVKRVEG